MCSMDRLSEVADYKFSNLARIGNSPSCWCRRRYNHAHVITAIDLCIVPTAQLQRLFALRAMGIRDRPISPRAPWQNGIAERLIGTLRRERLDHVVVFGERHLHGVLSAYAAYYNQTRTHRSPQKDAPLRRAIQRIGHVAAIPILGGLHHQYVRI